MGHAGVVITTARLKYVQRVIDRYGSARFYFRRPGYPSTRLPDSPGDPEFMLAYNAALSGLALEPKAKQAPAQDGTIAAAVRGYYASIGFMELASKTKESYRSILNRFVADYGAGAVKELKRHHVLAILAKKV